jgi:hypothetical protein
MFLHLRTPLARALFTLSALSLPAAGCATDDMDDGPGGGDCLGGKCDTPNDPPALSCAKRQAEVISSSNRGYTPEGIRWACADVEGVNANNRDDRGQEYCEYYAVVQIPGTDEPIDLGRPKSSGGVTDLAVCVEGSENGQCRTVITEDQLFDLEDTPDAVVGACLFNSWHADVSDPYPNCRSADDCQEGAKVFGLPLTAENAKMKVGFNGNGAAVDLVQRCFELGSLVPEPNFDDPDDPNNDPFFRGCMATNRLFGTEWRRSDPSICAAVNRLEECGCSAEGVSSANELGRAVVGPPGSANDGRTRGFALGTWDDKTGLPPGCRYADVGEDSRTSVVCELTAADLVASLNDPKEACRAIYGANVVVHVDLPVAAITCQDTDRFGNACGERPWNIGDENAPGTDPGDGTTGGDPGSGDPADCLHLAEVFYDAVGADDGKEWVKLYNACDETVSLEGFRIRYGGEAYGSSASLSGEVSARGCFVVGGPTSDETNGAPSYDLEQNFSPDLQNGTGDPDGIGLFAPGRGVPVDAVIYGDGEENTRGLIDDTGAVPRSPHVGRAPAGGSLLRASADRWVTQDTPTAADCPDF